MHVFDWSTNPILLKIDLHVRFTMMHAWKSRFFKKLLLVVANLYNLHFFLNTFVCKIMTDLLIRFCWKLIYMYVLWWCMSKYIFFSKLLLVVPNLCYLRFFANRFVCTVFDWSTYQPDFAKNWYTCTLYDDSCLNNHFFQNYY